MWVYLNEVGKDVWGNIFPDGKVPVASMSFQDSNVGRVIPVAWGVLTEEQKQAILTKLSEVSGAPKKAILKDIKRIGLPLRKIYTDGTIVGEMRFFI